MAIKDKLRMLLYSFAPTRELLFFVFNKRVYKRSADKKIAAFLAKQSNRRDDSEQSGINSDSVNQIRASKNNKRVDNLIVSLTSFPERIPEVKYAVYSLMTQTLQPEKIVLWLAESQFPRKEDDLPADLLSFVPCGLDIRWCEDLRSYKKLIPSLETFPDSFIATADDDICYNKRWLEGLWNARLANPGQIVCHVAKVIEFGADGAIIPFTQWKRNTKNDFPARLNVQLGAGGVLYHREYLHGDIFKKDLYQRLAPHADDLWFYFMAMLKGTPVCVAASSCDSVKYVNPYREYGFEKGYTLLEDNVNNGGNDRQFQNLIDHYKIDLHTLTEAKSQ